MSELEIVMSRTDWGLLKEQKAELCRLAALDSANTVLLGLVLWIDAIQDAVVKDGYDEAVVFGELED